MSPRSIAIRIREIYADFARSGLPMPEIEIVGDRIIVRAQDASKELTDEARKLQSSMEDAFGGRR